MWTWLLWLQVRAPSQHLLTRKVWVFLWWNLWLQQHGMWQKWFQLRLWDWSYWQQMRQNGKFYKHFFEVSYINFHISVCKRYFWQKLCTRLPPLFELKPNLQLPGWFMRLSPRIYWHFLWTGTRFLFLVMRNSFNVINFYRHALKICGVTSAKMSATVTPVVVNVITLTVNVSVTLVERVTPVQIGAVRDIMDWHVSNSANAKTAVNVTLQLERASVKQVHIFYISYHH